jgi:alpha-L-fucosidase
MELRAALDEIFAEDLSEDAKVEADNVRGGAGRFKAQNLLSDDYDKYWAVDDDVTAVSFIVRLPEARTFNRVQLQEYIPLGQRVSAFTIDALSEDGTWQTIARETTIGYKRIVHVPTTTATAVRVNIEESGACPVLNGFALFMDNIYTSLEMSNVPSGEVKQASEYLVADLGEVKSIRGFVYAPKVGGEDGVIVDYQVEISNDGNTWTAVSPVLTFNNIVNNPISQEMTFRQYVETRYLRLIPHRVLGTNTNADEESSTYGVSVFGCIQ